MALFWLFLDQLLFFLCYLLPFFLIFSPPKFLSLDLKLYEELSFSLMNYSNLLLCLSSLRCIGISMDLVFRVGFDATFSEAYG
jgi:hypothetical protein